MFKKNEHVVKIIDVNGHRTATVQKITLKHLAQEAATP